VLGRFPVDKSGEMMLKSCVLQRKGGEGYSMRLDILANQADTMRLIAEEMLDAIATLSATIQEEGAAITNEFESVCRKTAERIGEGIASEMGQKADANSFVPCENPSSGGIFGLMPVGGVVSVCGDKIIRLKVQ
jgi:hypothetical protein